MPKPRFKQHITHVQIWQMIDYITRFAKVSSLYIAGINVAWNPQTSSCGSWLINPPVRKNLVVFRSGMWFRARPPWNPNLVSCEHLLVVQSKHHRNTEHALVLEARRATIICGCVPQASCCQTKALPSPLSHRHLIRPTTNKKRNIDPNLKHWLWEIKVGDRTHAPLMIQSHKLTLLQKHGCDFYDSAVLYIYTH